MKSEQDAIAELRRRFGPPKKIRHVTMWKALDHLTIMFVGLKLAHFIDWSWAFVLAPTLLNIAMTSLVSRFVRRAQIACGYDVPKDESPKDSP